MSNNKSVPQFNPLAAPFVSADLFHVVRSGVDYKVDYVTLLASLNADLTPSGGVAGLDVDYIPVATSSTSLGNSWLSQNPNAIFIEDDKTFNSSNSNSIFDLGGGDYIQATNLDVSDTAQITLDATTSSTLSHSKNVRLISDMNNTELPALSMPAAGITSLDSPSGFEITGGTKFLSETASRVPYLDSNKRLVASTVTPTELGYVSGVTSNIQSQINALTVSSKVFNYLNFS